MSLTPMLSPAGKLMGDFTVSCLSEGRFRLTASYGYQAIHQRWFDAHAEEGVTLANVSDLLTGFQLAGPKATQVLAPLSPEVSEMAFLDVRSLTIGPIACTVQRISYTGDLGYEIYCHPADQRALWQALWQVGQPHGLTPFGMRAMMSLRLDRFFGSWLREFSPDYTAAETGMDRFIHWSKPEEFIGRKAAEAERETPPARHLITLEVDATDTDVTAYEPVFLGDEVIGFCTSGGFSHHAQTSIAFALVPRSLAAETFEIELLGQRRPARRITQPLL